MAHPPEPARALEDFPIPMQVWRVMHEDPASTRRIRLLFDFLVREPEVLARMS